MWPDRISIYTFCHPMYNMYTKDMVTFCRHYQLLFVLKLRWAIDCFVIGQYTVFWGWLVKQTHRRCVLRDGLEENKLVSLENVMEWRCLWISNTCEEVISFCEHGRRCYNSIRNGVTIFKDNCVLMWIWLVTELFWEPF